MDACNASGQFSEPYNEMVRFKTGGTSLPITQIGIAGKGNTGSFSLNKWPNVNQSWHGLVQNTNTASKVSAINASIQACGFVKEPPAGVIPANAEVIMVCSQYMNPTSNSFANLNDTIYMIFQDTVSSSTQGHFANWSATSSFRSLVLIDNAAGCSDTVKYDVSLLPLHTDGDAVEYDNAGNATYVNHGCQAPYVPLTIDAGADQTICFNDSAALTATPGGQYSSIAWSLATPSYGSFTSATALTTTFVPSGTAISPVKVYVTLFTVCGTNVKDSMLVNLTPAATPIITGSTNSNAVCLGSNFVLSVSQQSGTTYSWSPGPASGTSYTVSPSSQTIYTVFATNACTTSTATFTLSVNPLPVIAVATDTICRGATGAITATGATTYTWSTSATTPSITASPTITTQYSVTGTDGNGCIGNSTGEIFVYALPTVSASTSSVCPGATATLTASGAQTYTWSTTQTGASVAVTPTATATYTVVGTDNHSCSNVATTTVTVFTPAVISAPPASVCPGGTATLTASGAQSYTWSTAQVSPSITVTPFGAANYTVVGTDVHGCQTSTVTAVSISPMPTVTVNSPSACPGATVTLTAAGASSYTWSTAQVATSINVTASATSYTVIGANSNGCLDTAVATITLQAMPTAQSINGNTVICAGQADALSATPGGAYSYSWSGPAGNAGSGSTATVNQAGVYTLTTSNACGNVYSYFTVTVSTPTAAFAPNTFTGHAPTTFTFTNSSNGTQLSNYWNFADGNTSQQSNPVETYTAAGTYDVSLLVTDVYGCTDTAMITVYVTDTTPPIIIPNIFTPNGDSINDIFMVSGKGISYFNCKIYDRWGITLYEWNNVGGGWDGKNASNGDPVSDGTYYYLVTYIYGNNKLGVKPGFLQLVR